MSDTTDKALDALQERLRRIEWGVTGEPCAAGNVDETAALESDTAITALRARLSLYEGSTGPVSVSGIVQDMEGTIDALRAQLAVYEAAGIVEIAARNPSVMEYVRHWEGRAERAEAALATARADAVKVKALVDAVEQLGLRSLVAGWNGEGREKPYPPHPETLIAIIKTTCGTVYAVDAALARIKDAAP
jgi:DNA-binding transcriptional ArsR family regulator